MSCTHVSPIIRLKKVPYCTAESAEMADLHGCYRQHAKGESKKNRIGPIFNGV